VNNTFHTVGTGVRIEAPFTGLKRFTLARNYFAAARQIAAGPEGGNVAGFAPTDNARDARSQEGNLPSGAVEVSGFTLPAPKPDAPDADFLRPAPGKLDVAGPKKERVGAQ
jgi:hypothetical protein